MDETESKLEPYFNEGVNAWDVPKISACTLNSFFIRDRCTLSKFMLKAIFQKGVLEEMTKKITSK